MVIAAIILAMYILERFLIKKSRFGGRQATFNVSSMYLFYDDDHFLHNMKYYKFVTSEELQQSASNTYIISGKHLSSRLMFNYMKYTQFK